jgi:hypothetical protein
MSFFLHLHENALILLSLVKQGGEYEQLDSLVHVGSFFKNLKGEKNETLDHVVFCTVDRSHAAGSVRKTCAH